MRTLLFSLCIVAAACGGKKDDKPSSTPAAKPAGDPAVVSPTETAKPEPVKPAAPTYSADSMKAQLAKLTSCSSAISCEPLDVIVGFGAKAGPDLVAFVTDTGKPLDQRRVAAAGLGKLKFAEAGPKLVELALAADADVTAQMDFFAAAGECGGDATFAALTARYDQENHGDPKDHLVELRQGLAKYGAKAFAYARDAMPKAKDVVKYADVITDVATAADKDAVATLALAATDKMAANRLASKAISLGATDAKLFAPLISALESEDQYDRSDAGNFLAPIAAKIPADQKAKVVELLRKALSGPKDPMLNRGLEKTLEKLGG